MQTLAFGFRYSETTLSRRIFHLHTTIQHSFASTYIYCILHLAWDLLWQKEKRKPFFGYFDFLCFPHFPWNHCVATSSLEFLILPPSPKCSDYSSIPYSSQWQRHFGHFVIFWIVCLTMDTYIRCILNHLHLFNFIVWLFSELILRLNEIFPSSKPSFKYHAPGPAQDIPTLCY